MATAAPSKPRSETLPLPKIPSRGGAKTVRVIPLGGVGEFGMNMMCYEVGDERILVDCGSMFPDADMHGVDLVIPDISYLLDEPERLKGIILTHAHEDHIGALPYILSQIQAPIYATGLTLAYIEEKLEEHNLAKKTEMIELHYREEVSLGRNFQIRALHVTHSIPDAASIVVRTPAGVLIHTGDYKIDYSPLDGEAFDFYSFAELGEEGVLALVGDSTNANVPGSTRTENWLEPYLESIFTSSEGAILCATFSTSIHRLQVMMDMAARFDRKIFVAGRSLERTFRIATDLGYLNVPYQNICALKDIKSVEPRERFILATGSQGEPMSVMARVARGEHKKIKVLEGDSLILSARRIPNNERLIEHMVNHFCRRGARIFDTTSHKIHVSGHAYSEEIKALISLTRPRYLIPVHGELRQLLSHRDLALSIGMEDESIFIIENGDVLEMSEAASSASRSASALLVAKTETGRVLVDGKTVGETGDVVLRDRRHLSEDGMLIAILNVDQKTGEILSAPEIVTRGFVYVDESEELIERLRDLVRETFENCNPESREVSEVVNLELRRALKKYIKKNYARFPLILPVIQEI